MDPLFAAFEVPELNARRPLNPSTPPLLDMITMSPLLFELPAPASMQRQPPRREGDRPVERQILPPAALAPPPTEKLLVPL